jgi:hypothetical protein
MTESKKQLKIASFLVLILAAISTVDIALELCFGKINSVHIPDGAPENTLLIAKIIIGVVSAMILIPQFYVGIKGLRIVKNPTKSKAHIICAIVILGFIAWGLVENVLGIVSQSETGDYVGALLDHILEGIVYIDYVRYARAVAKGK